MLPAQHSARWFVLWEELCRIQPSAETSRLSPTATFDGAIEFPYELIWSVPSPRTIPEEIKLIEDALGATVKELAVLLRVSRPMIYHWRAGMEPSLENRARIEAVARLAADWSQMEKAPLGQRLHLKQAEGNTLLDLLSDEMLDVPAIRVVLKRLVGAEKTGSSEIATRESLLWSITKGEAAATRTDVLQERKAAGKPSYIGDPKNPGKLIEILPDGTHRSGRMVSRRFVPDNAE
jgi:transcriptional regulator with XRE-family HTH domain